MRLIHITDPHLSNLDDVRFSDLRGKRWSGYLSWNRNRRKKYMPAVLERLSDAIKHENADQVLLTGDLVQIGLEQEVEQAAQWLETLGPAEQVMLVPGNHDIYARGSGEVVHRLWAKYLFHGLDGRGSDFPVLRKLGSISLIGVSTACVSPVFMASGRLGEKQLDQLSDLLRQASSERQQVCLLIHHPPLPGMTNWRKGLADAEKLQVLLEKFPPLFVFHGHLHHNREQQWGNTRIYCTSAASSLSEASYRVVDIEDDGDVMTLRVALKSMSLEQGDDLRFVTIDEQSWQHRK